MELMNERIESPGAQVVKVVLETVITVPTGHLPWLVPALRRAGLEARDTGERTTSEEGIDALADVRVRVPA
jgi:hypothetical protein